MSGGAAVLVHATATTPAGELVHEETSVCVLHSLQAIEQTFRVCGVEILFRVEFDPALLVVPAPLEELES